MVSRLFLGSMSLPFSRRQRQLPVQVECLMVDGRGYKAKCIGGRVLTCSDRLFILGFLSNDHGRPVFIPCRKQVVGFWLGFRLKPISAAAGFAYETLAHENFQKGLVANALAFRDRAGLCEIGFRQA